MTRRPNHRRAAFTLIELVASAVLTAMMMAGLLGVVWSAVRESSELRKAEADRFPITILADQLRLDFQNSRGMSAIAGGVVLHGFMGDGSLPGRVAYQIQVSQAGSVLMRTDARSAEIAWVGATAIEIDAIAIVQPGDGDLPIAETGGLSPVPSVFRVTLRGRDGRVLFREVVNHHDA
ncbi:MAG: prepilin-type N-terminal cleavage/methylation domain-containing protein [Rubripirellula sp.]